MRKFVQLDNAGNVVGELETAGIPGEGPDIPAHMVEVTDLDDGPFLGKVYADGVFSAPVDARPICQIVTRNAGGPTAVFDVGEAITIQVAILDPLTLQVIPNFEQLVGQSLFIVEIHGPAGGVPVRFTFSGGQASRTVAGGLGGPGRYWIDQGASGIVRIPRTDILIAL